MSLLCDKRKSAFAVIKLGWRRERDSMIASLILPQPTDYWLHCSKPFKPVAKTIGAKNLWANMGQGALATVARLAAMATNNRRLR